MLCPNCHNKGWEPKRGLETPIVNIGGKQYYNTGAVRRYVCVNCGCFIKTSETMLMKAEASDSQLKLVNRLSEEQRELIKEIAERESGDQNELFDYDEVIT